MKIIKIVLFFCSLHLINSCSIGTIRNYTPHFKTVRTAKKIKGSFKLGSISEGKELNLGKGKKKNELDVTLLTCRATSMLTPNGKPLRDYISKAFEDSLDAAEKLSSVKGDAIDLTINKLSLNSVSGYWKISIKYQTPKVAKSIETKHEFETSFTADAACRTAKDTFPLAIDENFNEFYLQLSK